MKRNLCFLCIAFQLCISCALTVKETTQIRSRDLRLSRPYNVRWHIKGDTVILNWKYRKNAPPPLGYYVQVQESLTKKPLGSPDFVRVNDDSRSVEIRGLKPHSLYLMKVVAFSDSKHKPSRIIKVKTTNLAFLEAFDLKASSITDTSASFTWKHTPKNNVHDIQFKLSCNGVTNYQEHGNTVEEDIYFEHLSSSSSSGKGSYSTSTLVPNTLYTCHMLSVADNKISEPHSEIQFVTLPGKPPRPSRPKVIVATSQSKPTTSFQVELFPVSNIFGEISHYTVFAVPVSRGTNAARSMPYTPTVPYHQLLSKAVSAHLASSVSDKLPFIIGKYEAGQLPHKLVFDGSFRTSDFKADTHYAFVLAAFTKTKSSTGMRYSQSDPSDPPVYIGPDMQKEWIQQRKPAAKQFASTVLYTVIMAIVILTIIVLILVGLAYMKQQEYETILSLSDEESEIEIFTRSPKKNRGRNKRKNKKLLLLDPLYKDSTNDGRITKKYGKNSSRVYHSIDTTANNKQQKRVDEVKRFSQFDEEEGRPNLYSVVTPPDSPRSSSRPTSPLLQARRGNPGSPSPRLLNNQSTLPMIGPSPVSPTFPQPISPYHVIHEPHCMEYMSSPVATNINIEEDIIASSFTLPRARPYSLPRSMIKSQYYYKTHPPGSPMPKMPAPEAPKPAARKVAIQTIQKGNIKQVPQTGVYDPSKREVSLTKEHKQSCNLQTTVPSPRGIKPIEHHPNEVRQQTNLDGMLMLDEELEKHQTLPCSVLQVSSMDDELFVDALSH